MRRQSQLVARFEVAGVPCALESADDAFAGLLAPTYADFATDESPNLSLTVELAPPPSDDEVRGWRGPFARITGGEGALAVEGPGFRGAFDERSGRGWIVQPPEPAPFETFLTAILAGRLLRESGCLLHAAGLLGPAGARVFFGPSESGKTTVSRLVGEGVISDEYAALRRTGDGWRVSGVPWRGARLEGPLAGLFRLRKADATAFARLAPVAALRELAGSVLFARADGAEVARFLEVAGRLVAETDCWEMRFTPDRGFWDALPRPARAAVRC
jgi:hypothetical protein